MSARLGHPFFLIKFEKDEPLFNRPKAPPR